MWHADGTPTDPYRHPVEHRYPTDGAAVSALAIPLALIVVLRGAGEHIVGPREG
jgi:hypothetical protein